MPVKSNFNPASGASMTTVAPTVTLNTDENADCKMVADGSNLRRDDGRLHRRWNHSQSCAVIGLAQGANSVYIACRDSFNNADTAAQASLLSYTVDSLPPRRAQWNPAQSATVKNSAPTITFTPTKTPTANGRSRTKLTATWRAIAQGMEP